MNGSSSIGSRPIGVGIPMGQLSPGTGAPKTVEAVHRAETYGVRWVDDSGQVHQEFMHYMAGVWYRAPNGENYAAGLRPIAEGSWLAKSLRDVRTEAETPAKVPEKDAVDVMSEG